jgi:hypothetical protein
MRPRRVRSSRTLKPEGPEPRATCCVGRGQRNSAGTVKGTVSITALTRHEWRGALIELANVWILEKSGRTLVCRLTSHPLGWELRLELDRELWRSQACKVEDDVFSTAEQWRAQPQSHGWTPA